MKKDVSGTPCQVAEITTSSLCSKSGDSSSPSNLASTGSVVTTSFQSQQPQPQEDDLRVKSNMVTVVAASSATATSTTSAISSNGSTGAGLVPNSVGSSFANTLAASTSITLSSAGIPVGIAIARQRYVANSETVVNKTTTPFKDTGNVSCSAAVVAPSSSASYSSVIPCHSTILSSGFAATPLGVIAESINCPPKHANELAPTVTNLQPFWSTQTGGISGTATLPMSIAQPQQTQTQQPSATPLPISIPTQTQQSAQTLTAAHSSLAMPHQHAAVSQWHSYTGAAMESQIATGMPSTCGGFQIARDSVSGQIILIPTGQIDSTIRQQQQRNLFLVPSGGIQQSAGTASAAACSSTNHHHHQQQQTQQSFFISQQQQSPSPSYSIVLDHLVTATSALPTGIIKQKPASIPSAAAAVVKLDNGLLTTGVMMPCGLAKSSPLQHNNASAAIGQQLISSNNSSFSLVQQLTSSNVHNSNVNIPHHFSTISSSGSLVIQQISGNTVPSPLLNHVNNSLLISAEAAATQSILNAQTPQYVPNNTSFLFNAQQLTSSTSSSSTLSAVPDNVVSSYADGSTPSSTSFIISTSCANRNDVGTGISLATSGSNMIPIDNTNTGASSTHFKPSCGVPAVAAVSTSMAVIAATTTAGTSCTSTLSSTGNITSDDIAAKCQLYVKSMPSLISSDSQHPEQITLFKATEESWSVQDAGNQTETNDDQDGCCYDSDKKSIDSDSSEESTRLKIDPDHEVSSCESDVEEVDSPVSDKEPPRLTESTPPPPVIIERSSKGAETPDFSGLQLLLNGIEQVEHVRDTSTDASVSVDTAAAASSVAGSDEDTVKAQPANGLEILCALADQRFYEENEDDKDGCARQTGASKKKSTQQRIRDAFEDDSFSSAYRYKNDSSPVLKSNSDDRLFSSTKHERSVSPYEGNQLKMRQELARLQKKYRETRKVLDRLTHGKYAANISSSSTRSPTPLKDVAATTAGASSEPDFDSKTIATPVKRRPGRPRKYSDPSLALDKSNLSSSSSASLQRSSVPPASSSSKSLRPKPKLKFDSILDSSSPEKTSGNGDLSPPVLEPMCVSSTKVAKPFKSAVLSPPTLLPSKKSQRLQSPFFSRGKRSHSSRDGLDGFSSSEPEEDYGDEIDSDEDDYEQTRRSVYGNDALKVRKNFYKGGYLDDNGKETSGLKRPMPEKRKVGRPRKYPKVEPQNQTTTEAMNCKNQNKSTSSRFLTGASKLSKYISSAMLESQRKPIHSSQFYDKECKPKITPKLKAEAKLKTWRQESPSPEANSPNDSIDCPFTFTNSTSHKASSSIAKKSKSVSASDDDERSDYLSRTLTHRPSSHFGSISSKNFTNSKFCSSNSTTTAANTKTSSIVTAPDTTTNTGSAGASDFSNDDFRITVKLLEDVEANPLRVLIAVGGLFRAGELSAVRAPDLYGIKLDGERGHRTHIYTKEEVLRDVVLEVEGKYPLKNGTRVCAFWSSQYLSLYPGFVTSFSSSDESEDEYFTSVEFDDGDSGRINIKDIRLLPKNFSISRRTLSEDSNTQYPNNHDHHKRKRRISGVSFEEIPVDKQLHSPKSPSLSTEEGTQDDESSQSRRISTASSARKSFTEYEDTGSRSSSFDQNDPESRSNFEPSTSGDEVSAPKIRRREDDNQDGDRRIDSKNSPQKKHLKKKRKDKLRAKDSASSSFKRKSHKCDDNDHDSDSRKSHKRHKHKHKHRKHHKRKRSSSSERKYLLEDVSSRISKQNSNDGREIFIGDDLDISCRSEADCSKESCCNKNNNNSSKNIACGCKTKRSFNDKHSEVPSMPLKGEPIEVDDTSVDDRITSTVKKEEFEPVSKYGAINSGGLKQSKPHEGDDIEAFNSFTNQLGGSQSKSVNRKTARPQISASVQPIDSATASLNRKQSSKQTKSEKTNKEEKRKEEKREDEKEEEDRDDDEDEDDEDAEEEEESSEDSRDNQDEPNSGDNFWQWCGKGFKRNGKGRAKKEFFQAIRRGDVEIRVGDCAVFLTAENSPKPFIGRIKSMWESYQSMMVLVKWFYHPEETSGLKEELPFLGGLFESPHDDKNDVQTISHKCEVVSIKEYKERLKKEPERLTNVYESNDVYYLAGHYDPTTKKLTLEKDVVS
ncbi:mucin-5AC isoform X2 [Planococcus citri]|uniref:mucin-5AC isoform X2 n=1 Tax=Planococcus citri TaxID=170843 RepID=UPI0031F73D24